MYTIANRIRPNPIVLSLLLILAVAMGACTFHVQPIEKYSSADGYLSLTHPAAWDVIEEDASDGTTTVLLGSNPDLVNVDVVPPGEAGIGIMLMPNFIPQPGLDTMTVGPEDMAALIRDSALQGQTGAEVGDLDEVTLADGSPGVPLRHPLSGKQHHRLCLCSRRGDAGSRHSHRGCR